MTELIYFASASAFALGCQAYDTYMTEKGLKAGVAIEGNSWLVGPKPSALALSLRDVPITLLTAIPALVAFHFDNTGLFYASLAGPIAVGIKHILGGRSWAALLNIKK